MEEDGTPFLVTEYMGRGSYRDLLDDVTSDVTNDRKLGLCLDIAKGMEFLHGLNPPRVHRDLKCDNLLISVSWVGKVADFGLGKQISPSADDSRQARSFATTQQLVELGETYSLAIPILRLGPEEGSHGVGAAKWRAPELSRNRSSRCSTAVDVYRYTNTQAGRRTDGRTDTQTGRHTD